MKNKRSFICLMILITSIVISCSWQIPENVTVKTKADYDFGLGRVKYDLTDTLDVPKMLETQKVELPLGMKIYDYFPQGSSENVQRYLARIPIMEYPLDIEQYLKQLDMVTKMDAINFEKELPIPDIVIPPMEIPIPADEIEKYVNMGVTGAGFVNTGSSPLYPSAILEQAGITIGQAHYKSGTLIISGKDIQELAGGANLPLPPLPPEAHAEYKFSPTIKEGRVVTIDFGDGIKRTATVHNNEARFDLTNVIIDTEKTKITFDSAPEIEFVKEQTTGRSLQAPNSRMPSFDISDLDMSKLPGLDQLPIPAIPDVNDIINDPTIAEKIPDLEVTPDMKPDDIQNQLNKMKAVLVIEGFTATIDPTINQDHPEKNANLTKVTGITVLNPTSTETPKPVLDIPITVDPIIIEEFIPKMEQVELISAKIGEGHIAMNLNGLKAGFEIKLQSTGGLQFNTTISNDNTNLNLAKLTLNQGKSTITPSATIRLNKSEIDFDNLKLVLTPELKRIEEVTADLKTQIQVKEKFPLPAEVAKLVKKIGLNASGATIKYTNTLPEGNDIGFHLNSTFLGIDKDIKIKSNVKDEPAEILTTPSTVDPNGEVIKSGTTITLKSEGNEVDLNVVVLLPGAKPEHPTWVTIKNFEFNTPYKVALELTPVLNWDSVTVDTSTLPLPKGNIDTGVNLNKMIGEAVKDIDPDLVNRLSLPELPIYVFCTKPKLKAFDSLDIQAQASLMFGKLSNPDDPNSEIIQTPNSEKTYILGNDKGKASVGFVDSIPKINAQKGYVDTDFSKLDTAKNEVSVKLDLGKSLGNLLRTNGNLFLNYDVGITNKNDSVAGETSPSGEVTIKKSDLEGTNSTISLEAFIDLGLAFKLDPIKIDGKDKLDNNGKPIGLTVDLIKLAGLGEQLKGDLLQGMIPQFKEQGVDKVLELINEVSVDYNLNALPLALPPQQDLTVEIKMDPQIEKSIGLTHGKITINKDDLTRIFNDKSQQLVLKNIDINVPAGIFSVKRNKMADVNINVAFSTDGSLKIMENGQVVIGGGAK